MNSVGEEAELEESRDEPLEESARLEEDREAVKEDEWVARIKYTLATSSLLAPRLQLSLYPQSSTPPVVSQLVQTGRKSGKDVVERNKVEWGTGWENRGTRWNDHSLIKDVDVVGRWIVAYIWSIILLVYSQYFRPQAITKESTIRNLESSPTGSESLEVLEGVDTKARVLDGVHRLVSVSQQLDNRISRSLGGIREVESVGLGLGLSVAPLFSSRASADDPHTARTRIQIIRHNLPSRIAIASALLSASLPRHPTTMNQNHEITISASRFLPQSPQSHSPTNKLRNRSLR